MYRPHERRTPLSEQENTQTDNFFLKKNQQYLNEEKV